MKKQRQNGQYRRKVFSASFKTFFDLTLLNTAPKKQEKKAKKWGGGQNPLLFISSFSLFPLKMSSLPTPFFTPFILTPLILDLLKTFNMVYTIDKKRGV
ncbi:MAG: hypothetical protein QCI00_00855 [Candidatus Thermoplasmatota archaeon]|nr:hypothetical protein [Candidatus Thermoplasmatota archaeon]